MALLSNVLYFLTHHPVLSFPLILLAFVALGVAAAMGRRKISPVPFIFLGFLAGMANVFLGHIVNAVFLHAEGVDGRAVIVSARETNSTLNDRNIWAYRAVLKTADGRDVLFDFDTMSAAIYPIRNEILIPPQGEFFAVKYIPGAERNVVILSDESDYGQKRKIEQDRGLVEEAAAQLAASPANPDFIAAYRNALQNFLAAHRADADPDLVQDYERKLQALGASH